MENDNGMRIIACARIRGNGTIISAKGVQSVVRQQAGVYTIKVERLLKDNSYVVFANVTSIGVNLQANAAEANQDGFIDVIIEVGNTGVATDGDFDFVAIQFVQGSDFLST